MEISKTDYIKNYIIEKYPFIDIIFDTKTFYKLHEMINKNVKNNNEILVEVEKNSAGYYKNLTTINKLACKAFVNIINRYNNF